MKSKITLSWMVLSFVFLQNAFTQQLIEKTLVYDGETREYSIYIPASYDGSTSVPLLFNFHGGNDNIASQLFISDMRPIADTANFILIYPQALPDPNDGGSTNWTHKAPTDVDDIFFVEAMIDVTAGEYLIDENRVYGCGYSNGGEFTFELACRLSDRMAGVGVVARSMFIETFNECDPSHPMPVLTIHGTEDDYEGIVFGGITYYVSLDDLNDYWVGFNNTDATPTIIELPNTNTGDGSTVERHIWQNGDACVSLEHLKVINGGHDWPGTFGNMDIDASLEIWNFVSQYTKNGLIGCATSVDELNIATEIQLFPNPITDLVSIQLNDVKEVEFEIYSVMGELVLEGILNSNKKEIDVSHLPANLYLLKIENQVKKLIKQ